MSKSKLIIIFLASVFVLCLDYFALKYRKSTDGLWHGHFNLETNIILNNAIEKCLELTVDPTILSSLKLIKLSTPFSFSEIELHQRVDMCYRRYQIKTHVVELKKQYYTRRNILLGNENHFVFSNKIYFKKDLDQHNFIEIFKQTYGLDNLKLYNLRNQKNYLFQTIDSSSASNILYICNYLTNESEFESKCLNYTDLNELKAKTKKLIDNNSTIN